MKNFTILKPGLLLAVLAMLLGFGLGGVFGAAEDQLKGKLKADGEAVLATVYENDTAKMEKVQEKSWAYMKRAHLHAGVMGIGAVALILLIGFAGGRPTDLRITAVALGAGSLLYGLFWLLAGFAAPSLGSTGAAKEQYWWLGQPAAAAYLLATVNVLRLLVLHRNTAAPVKARELAHA